MTDIVADLQAQLDNTLPMHPIPSSAAMRDLLQRAINEIEALRANQPRGSTELDATQVRRALEFYECSPDGQYDIDVVVPILGYWLEQHQITSPDSHRTSQAE